MGWKKGAILRKNVRQPKPEFLPFPDSEGVWECKCPHDDSTIYLLHAKKYDNEIHLFGENWLHIERREAEEHGLLFKKRKHELLPRSQTTRDSVQ